MSGRLIWDQLGEKKFETGASNAILFPMISGSYQAGVAWNGFKGITESPSGAEPTSLWADNIKYANMLSAEEFGGTIEAYMYPDEFEECDGSAEIAGGVVIGQQPRKPFGLCYLTLIGNDTDGDSYGEKIHIVYNGLVSPSDKGYKSKTDSPEAVDLSWEFKTTAVPVSGYKPTATLTINSTKCNAVKYEQLKDILFGKDAVSAGEGVESSPAVNSRLPLPDEITSLVGPAVG